MRPSTGGETKYTSVTGTQTLQTAILQTLELRTGIRYSPAEITIGGGAKQVIFTAFMATLDAGDEVVVPAPYWVSYPVGHARTAGTGGGPRSCGHPR